jgi:hypothetical protein
MRKDGEGETLVEDFINGVRSERDGTREDREAASGSGTLASAAFFRE